jgi:hypothetical protein
VDDRERAVIRAADDFDVIAVRLRALDEKARGYCKNRDPEKLKLPADHRCWCYVLGDASGGPYACPPMGG